MPNKQKASSLKETLQNIRALISLYPRITAMVWKASPYAFLGCLMTSILGGLIPPSQAWLLKVIIDSVVVGIEVNQTGGAVDLNGIIWLLGFYLGLMATSAALQALFAMSREFVGRRVEYYIQQLILKKAATLDYAFFEDPKFYNMLTNANQDASWRPANFVWLLVDILRDALTLIAMILILTRLHVLAAVAIGIVALVRLVFMRWHVKRRFLMNMTYTTMRRAMGYFQNLMTSRESIKEVRIFALFDHLYSQYAQYKEEQIEAYEKIKFSETRVEWLFSTFSNVVGVGVWAYIVFRALYRHITIGDITLFFQAVNSCQQKFGDISQTLVQGYENSLFITNLSTFLDLNPDNVEGALKRSEEPPRTLSAQFIEKDIEIRDVSFKYPGQDRYVLRNVSFSIRPGETVAIVGRNGAGKTTLVKLLARFYDPTEGEILLNGHSLVEYDLVQIRQQMSIVFQDFVQYHLTIRDNIAFGQIEHSGDTVRLEKAAEDSGAWPLIQSLPKKFDTVLGRTLEEGVDLSGGEWQKLGLARAFFRDAHLLILDEPTASLDPLAEYELFQQFARLTQSKTSVIISHRFSTVQMADRIIVLQDGQCIEQGSHEELLARGGIYAELFTTQAKHYYHWEDGNDM